MLLDFGTARRAVAEKSRALTGIVKAGYSPQEQYAADSRLQGPWSDLYAFGGTLYRAVTGKAPEEATLRFDEDRMAPAVQGREGQLPARLPDGHRRLPQDPARRATAVGGAAAADAVRTGADPSALTERLVEKTRKATDELSSHAAQSLPAVGSDRQALASDRRHRGRAGRPARRVRLYALAGHRARQS